MQTRDTATATAKLPMEPSQLRPPSLLKCHPCQHTPPTEAALSRLPFSTAFVGKRLLARAVQLSREKEAGEACANSPSQRSVARRVAKLSPPRRPKIESDRQCLEKGRASKTTRHKAAGGDDDVF